MNDYMSGDLMAAIISLKDATAAGFAKADARIDALDAKFDVKIDALDTKIERLRYDMNRRFDAVDERFDRLERRSAPN